MEKNMESNQPPLPPYLAEPPPIGFDQAHQQIPPYPVNNIPVHSSPQPYSGSPTTQMYNTNQPPLNAYNAQTTYISQPFVHQQPVVYGQRYNRRFRGFEYGNRKGLYIFLAIAGVMFVLFLTVFFVTFSKF